MSKKFSYPAGLNEEKAFEMVKTHLETFRFDQFPITPKIAIDEGERKVHANAKGVKIVLDFGESAIDLVIDLAFIYKPFRKKIEKELLQELEEVLCQ